MDQTNDFDLSSSSSEPSYAPQSSTCGEHRSLQETLQYVPHHSIPPNYNSLGSYPYGSYIDFPSTLKPSNVQLSNVWHAPSLPSSTDPEHSGSRQPSHAGLPGAFPTPWSNYAGGGMLTYPSIQPNPENHGTYVPSFNFESMASQSYYENPSLCVDWSAPSALDSISDPTSFFPGSQDSNNSHDSSISSLSNDSGYYSICPSPTVTPVRKCRKRCESNNSLWSTRSRDSGYHSDKKTGRRRRACESCKKSRRKCEHQSKFFLAPSFCYVYLLLIYL